MLCQLGTAYNLTSIRQDATTTVHNHHSLNSVMHVCYHQQRTPFDASPMQTGHQHFLVLVVRRLRRWWKFVDTCEALIY